MRPNALVPHHLNGQDPSYLVVAGLVFTVLTGVCAWVYCMPGCGDLLCAWVGGRGRSWQAWCSQVLDGLCGVYSACVDVCACRHEHVWARSHVCVHVRACGPHHTSSVLTHPPCLKHSIAPHPTQPNPISPNPHTPRPAAPYLQSEYGDDFGREAPVRLLEKLLLGKKRFPDEQVVVVSQVLACDATIGYEDWSNVQVGAAGCY